MDRWTDVLVHDHWGHQVVIAVDPRTAISVGTARAVLVGATNYYRPTVPTEMAKNHSPRTYSYYHLAAPAVMDTDIGLSVHGTITTGPRRLQRTWATS